jgi:murein DD-endopeptidase MepM/ murein hydrolase activator NlpD
VERGPRHLRRTRLRRPAYVLAAAFVAALGVGLGTATTQHAAASSGPGTSVAAELGLTGGQAAATAPMPTDELREMTVSRAQRRAETSAAAQAQADRDQAAVAAAAEAARPKAVLPVDGARLTTCFCLRWGAMHWGIDLAGPLGTPEHAAVDGVVLKAGPASGFGQAVYIQGADGDVTVYGHMEKLLVQAGQVVKAGDEIALMGSEGESTGSHLHFEVHQGGLEGPRVDPVPWLAARGVQVPGA